MRTRILAVGLIAGLCVVGGCKRAPTAPRGVDYAAAAHKAVSDAAPAGEDAWDELQAIIRDTTKLARTTGNLPLEDRAYFKLKEAKENEIPFPQDGLRMAKLVGDEVSGHLRGSYELGERIRVAFEASDLPARLSAAAPKSRFVRPKVSGSIKNAEMIDAGEARALARLNLERFAEAVERGDDTVLPSIVDQSLTLARCYLMQGSGIERLVGRAIEAGAFDAVRVRLARPASEELLRGFDKILSRHAETKWGHEAAIEWQRCELLDEAQRAEERGRDVEDGVDAVHAALARWSEAEIAAVRTPLPARWAEERKVKSVFEEVSKESEFVKSRLVPLDGFQSDAVATAERPGMVVMVALERFRLAKGKYPERLTELVPAYLKAVPTDPGNAQPLVYRRIDPPDAEGERGRGYLLYSVGADGKDDGGVLNKATRGHGMSPLPNMGAGTDFIINSLAQ